MKREKFMKLVAAGAATPIFTMAVGCTDAASPQNPEPESLVTSSTNPNIQQVVTAENAFDSIAALKKAKLDTNLINASSSSLTPNKCVQVLGYYEPGDGGGGIFYWDNKSSEEDNNGTIIEPAIKKFSGIGRWKRINKDYINPKWFGAKGDGQTDDQGALQSAHGVASKMKIPLYIPKGNTFAFNGSFEISVSIYSEGGSFKTLSTKSTYHCLSIIKKATDLTIKGLHIDGNGNTRGIYFAGFSKKITITDCNIKNCKNGGITVFSSDNIVIQNCKIENVIYDNPNGGNADGIYFSGCKRCKATGNDISDIRRIGIVSEANGSVKSHNTEAINNTIYNLHDEDDSNTEFNRAIWFENTNGGKIIGNQIYDIANNPGQDRGGVFGIQAVANGTNKNCTFIVSDNFIEVGNDNMPVGSGIGINGSNKYASVIIENNEIKNISGSAVHILEGLKNITIRNLYVNNIQIGGASNGVVVVDNDDNKADSITIENIKVSDLKDNDKSGNWAHINFYSGGAKNVTLSDLSNFILIVRQGNTAIDRLQITNSHINYGSSKGYGSLNAQELFVSNSIMTNTYRGDNRLIQIAAEVNAKFDNCIFEGSFLWGDTGNFSGIFSNCEFRKNAHVDFNPKGAGQLKFQGCNINDHSDQGFLRGNFYNSNNDRLFIRNCEFRNKTNVVHLQKRNGKFNPTAIILSGNTFTSSKLHNFDSVNQDINNLKI